MGLLFGSFLPAVLLPYFFRQLPMVNSTPSNTGNGSFVGIADLMGAPKTLIFGRVCAGAVKVRFEPKASDAAIRSNGTEVPEADFD
jgi:hypothetical protein